MAIPFVPYTFTDVVANDVTAARLNAIAQAARDAQLLPAVRVTHNAAQSITSATNTALAFNTEIFDQASGVVDTQHDTVTNNSRLTCRYAGIYQITGNVEWAANATGVRDVFIRHSVASTVIAYQRQTSLTAVTVQLEVSALYAMAVNEYVELLVFQNSGGALNLNSTSAYSPTFSMVRVA